MLDHFRFVKNDDQHRAPVLDARSVLLPFPHRA